MKCNFVLGLFFTLSFSIPAFSHDESRRITFDEALGFFKSNFSVQKNVGKFLLGDCLVNYRFTDNGSFDVSVTTSNARKYSYSNGLSPIHAISKKGKEVGFVIVQRVGHDCETQGCNSYSEYHLVVLPNFLSIDDEKEGHSSCEPEPTLTSPVSAFSEFAGEYAPTSWSCVGAYHWVSRTEYVKIYEKSDVILLNACAEDDDCEGRLPFENFYLSNMTSGDGWAKGESGSYHFSARKNGRIVQFEIKDETFTCTGSLQKISTKN